MCVKQLQVGDLVEVTDFDPWNSAPDDKIIGFIIDSGNYHGSFIVMFPFDGSERLYHESIMKKL
jgi:hypothetical protein